MTEVNVHEAKTHLSRYLAQVQEGGVTIQICRRNVPIAEIRALPGRSNAPRTLGQLKGQFEVPESFFEPLPDALSVYEDSWGLGVSEGFVRAARGQEEPFCTGTEGARSLAVILACEKAAESGKTVKVASVR